MIRRVTDFASDSIERGVEQTRQRWEDRTSTPARVYLALLETSGYTSHSNIATVAGCDPRTAEKYLDWFVEMGMAQCFSEPESPFYKRNDAYFEWFEVHRIAEQMEESDITERVDELVDRESEIASQFETDDPSTLRGPDLRTGTPDFDRLEKISEWQSVRQEIGLYRLAHHLCINDGHLISTSFQ